MFFFFSKILLPSSIVVLACSKRRNEAGRWKEEDQRLHNRSFSGFLSWSKKKIHNDVKNIDEFFFFLVFISFHHPFRWYHSSSSPSLHLFTPLLFLKEYQPKESVPFLFFRMLCWKNFLLFMQNFLDWEKKTLTWKWKTDCWQLVEKRKWRRKEKTRNTIEQKEATVTFPEAFEFLKWALEERFEETIGKAHVQWWRVERLIYQDFQKQQKITEITPPPFWKCECRKSKTKKNRIEIKYFQLISRIKKEIEESKPVQNPEECFSFSFLQKRRSETLKISPRRTWVSFLFIFNQQLKGCSCFLNKFSWSYWSHRFCWTHTN